ncbi:MAG TPA: hypothetical protein VM124_01390 [Candidatus Limnocylindrales bacterium]|nr:hypothetical protein [Candidatus Limnocylindrales bacterium]
MKNPVQPLQYSICVSGAASGDTVTDDRTLATRIGAAIARRGHVTTTGATVGLPFFAAKGAKEAGGMSIGFSPASEIRDHMRRYRLPREYFDFINFTGMHYVGRDTHLIQSSDAIITVGGRFGSLHEFVTALEAHKPCGILVGSEGAADIIPELMKVLEPPREHLVIYDENPENLVERIVSILDQEYADIIEQINRNEHWYLNGKRQG